MSGHASTVQLLTGYAYRKRELHAWYQPVGGIKRWVDNDQRVPDDEILKGNADLVPSEHAYLRVVEDDIARRIDMRHPSAPPDARSELIDSAMADFEVRR